MFTIGIVLCVGVATVLTPWRKLSGVERVWAALAYGVTTLAFSLPTTPATSPWRPVIDRAEATATVTSAALVIAGAWLMARRGARAARPLGLLGICVVAALPALLWGIIAVLWRTAH